MLIKAQQKYISVSTRKLNEVAFLVRRVGKPEKAILLLENVQKRAAGPIVKTLKQAVANAKNNFKLEAKSLKIKEIQINKGPTYKRGRPVSRGRSHPIKKRTSHITIILESEEEKVKELKVQSSK